MRSKACRWVGVGSASIGTTRCFEALARGIESRLVTGMMGTILGDLAGSLIEQPNRVGLPVGADDSCEAGRSGYARFAREKRRERGGELEHLAQALVPALAASRLYQGNSGLRRSPRRCRSGKALG